ncbi:MAG TPA: hypothetical protein P5087_04200 [Eubacteriales bacterium]|nr:hypothetical protein [Eubacteriales bacterium]
MNNKSEKKKYDDDDGRVIAKMNVDGMPWYDSISPKIKKDENGEQIPPITKKETRRLIGDMLFALIPVLGMFLGAFALLILLMTNLW